MDAVTLALARQQLDAGRLPEAGHLATQRRPMRDACPSCGQAVHDLITIADAGRKLVHVSFISDGSASLRQEIKPCGTVCVYLETPDGDGLPTGHQGE